MTEQYPSQNDEQNEISTEAKYRGQKALRNIGLPLPGQKKTAESETLSKSAMIEMWSHSNEVMNFAPEPLVIDPENVVRIEEDDDETTGFQGWGAPINDAVSTPIIATTRQTVAPVVEETVPDTTLIENTAHVVEETLESSLEDGSTAMQYFKGEAERQTYTAELRFRAQFQNEEKQQQIQQPAPETPVEDNWLMVGNSNVLQDFTPSIDETPRPIPANSGFNMLDLIDESYKSLNAGPQAHPRQAQVEIDYSQPSAKLPPPSSGLAGGLNPGTKGGGKFKRKWSKK